jgi:hypothetical protein
MIEGSDFNSIRGKDFVDKSRSKSNKKRNFECNYLIIINIK